MGILGRAISSEDLAAIHWQPDLPETDWRYPHRALAALHQRAAEDAELTENESAVRRLLHCAISMRLNPNTSTPFLPYLHRSPQSTPTVDHLDEEDVACLSLMADQTQSAWLKARLSDLACTAGLELGLKTWSQGGVATRSYLIYCQSHLIEQDGFHAVDDLQRGLELAWRFARGDKELYAAYWKLLMEAIQTSLTKNWLGIAFPLAEELLSRRKNLAEEAAELFQAAAERMAAESETVDFDSARRCFQLAARLWARAGKDPAAHHCQLQAGEAMIARSRGPGQAMLRADWLAEGIAILRRNKGDRQRIIELQIELSDVRRHIIDEMETHSYPIDTTEMREHVEARIVGPTIFEGLLQLTFEIASWSRHDKIRAQVLNSERQYPLSSMFAQVIYDHNGVPVSKTSSFDPSDEEQVYRKMVEHVRQFEHMLLGDVMILEAVDIFFNAFSPSFNFVLEVVHHSPVSPLGHERSLARGLLAGFNHDWHEAGTYLIPMVEPIVRAEFKRRGRNTLSIREDGSEEEKSLSELLSHEAAEEIFGATLILELRTLMTDKAGHNLRNRYAHGLLTDAMLVNTGVFVLWWTVWRMLLFPFQLEKVLAAKNEEATGDSLVEESSRPQHPAIEPGSQVEEDGHPD